MTGMRCGYYSNVDPILRYTRQRQKDIVALIREFVECESPSDHPPSVNRFVELMAERVKDIARVKVLPGGPRFGKHLRCEFDFGASKKDQQILALGHSDTVWPLGTLASMPYKEGRGRLWGPGTLDMKGGLAFFIFAMRALRDLEVPVQRNVTLQVNSDEEVGSETSREWTEEAARRSVAVLVLEPGTGLEGKLKTARKGVGWYTVTVRGLASHAGLDFTKGANAIVEMARQIEKIAGFTRLDRGVTVSVGVVRGGTRSNVVPAEGTGDVDFRAPRARDEAYLKKCFGSLKAFDKRCSVEISGGLNRPPLERTAGVRKLFKLASGLATELGVTL